MHKVKKYKLGRRLGAGVFEKCQTPAFAASAARKRDNSRGKRRRRTSDYGMQLLDKQRARVMYGVSEKQFSNYVKDAMLTKKPAQTLFTLLESRFDNTIYRMGLAPTRRMARQMVTHGHFMVNGKRLDVPSYRTKTDDIISVREGSRKTQLFTDLAERLKDYKTPSFVTFDQKKLQGSIKGAATNPDPFLDFQSVIEFYSR